MIRPLFLVHQGIVTQYFDFNAQYTADYQPKGDTGVWVLIIADFDVLIFELYLKCGNPQLGVINVQGLEGESLGMDQDNLF